MPKLTLRTVVSDPVLFLATGFGFGASPKAPGTAGSIWGLPLAWAIGQVPQVGPLPAAIVQVALIVAICAAGVPLCSSASRRLGGQKDPGAIVFDEIASLPITFFLIPWHEYDGAGLGVVLAAGFLLHRVFDITKPPPCRRLERLDGGLGIMADDWIAGIYSCLALHALLWIWQIM
ncbi:MAG: phosphatidylglycerophosphatase A [Pirellulales bacterium]